MNQEEFKQRIMGLPVFDTHSHINAPNRFMAAQSFADLGHYFWLSQQLKGVGWKESQTMNEAAAAAYFDAFIKTENTAMNWCLRKILFDLYGVAIRSPRDIQSADSIIRERADSAEHVKETCRKGNIQKITQNLVSQAAFPMVPELGVLVADTLNGPVSTFLENPSEDAAGEAISSLHSAVDAMALGGQKGARIDFNLFESIANASWRHSLLDAIFSRMNDRSMFVQMFIGMKRHARGSFPQDDPTRITGLIPFFQNYPDCRFELVCAAEGNCLDVVQAAVMNPNVHPGGLWWYTFRPSMYRQTLEQRLEALAPLKCPVLASDATCIEWCYGKTMLVKTLIAEFLAGKVAAGWISEECATRTASAWLYEAPAAYYPESSTSHHGE
jgi:glucuronate isomerase